MYDISEIIWKMTNPYSTVMENKIISGPYCDIEKLDDYVKETVQILKNSKTEIKKVVDAINEFWDYSAFFFLCHIYTELKQNNLSEERSWLKTELCKLFKFLKENNVPFKDNWIYWQYAQVPWKESKKAPKEKQSAEEVYKQLFDKEERKKREQRCNEWITLSKIAVQKFDPAADYNQKECYQHCTSQCC